MIGACAARARCKYDRYMTDLTLYADSTWQSPWVFHVMVALEELRVRYQLQALPMPLTEARRAELREHALLPKVPCLVDGELWLTESSEITEYLADKSTAPAHPRMLPADIGERARARQIMSWLRTSLMSLREDRPTSSVVQRPVTKPMSEKARVDAAELVRV